MVNQNLNSIMLKSSVANQGRYSITVKTWDQIIPLLSSYLLTYPYLRTSKVNFNYIYIPIPYHLSITTFDNFLCTIKNHQKKRNVRVL